MTKRATEHAQSSTPAKEQQPPLYGRFPATPAIDIPTSSTKVVVEKKNSQQIIPKQLKIVMEDEI